MTRPAVLWIVFILLLALVLPSCSEIREKPESGEQQAYKTESFAIYSSKDSLFVDENVIRRIAFVDGVIEVEQGKTRQEKLKTIADTLSKRYFNGLTIAISDSFGAAGTVSVAKINLLESADFNGPGTVPSYQSWYDFFQGTTGGQNTTITLRESLLQRHYTGEWVDGLVFYYQGEPIGDWDHIALHGFFKRE